MQVTELEIILFLWGVVSTWLYFREATMHTAAKKFLMLMLENKEARDKMVEAHKEFTANK